MSDSQSGTSGTYGLLLIAIAMLLLVSTNDDGAVASDAEPTPFPWQGLLLIAGIAVAVLIVGGVLLVIRDHLDYKHYLAADAAWQKQHGDVDFAEEYRNADNGLVVHAMRPQDPTNRIHYR